MESHYDLDDDQFEKQFQSADLPGDLFNHEAHLRLAWIHIHKYGCPAAIENITRQIRAYAAAVGAVGKYNHTLTIATVKTVDHFMRKSESNSFAAFIQEFPRLNTNFSQLLAVHYSAFIFESEKARQDFVEPDLLPFS